MLFYLDAHSYTIQEYLAKVGTYIGMLGNPDGVNIKPQDISLNKIKEHEKNDEFSVCSILNGSWWIGILFNTQEGANEIKMKYKGKPMLWYWISRDNLKFCLPHMQLKEFEKIFPIIKK
jgi:hypothetical protein